MTANRHTFSLIASVLVPSLLVVSTAWGDDAGDSNYQPGPLLRKSLDGPMDGTDEIVFAERISGRDHWYVTFGYYSCQEGPAANLGFGQYPDGKVVRGYGEGGRLCRLNLRTGERKVILDDPQGGVRDPQVNYDGKKLLFAYRPGGTPTFHLYEINIDGTGLRQLTDGPDDDIEPTYLPDGGIMFCSSRCRRFVNCWYIRVATLYRCEGDGSNVRMISSNNDHDNTPWVLEDGRVIYMRWEYVDRSQVHFHHLWTVNPDGTNQMVWFGNEFAGTAMLDAKPIPGTGKVVSSFSPGHGLPEHMGHVTIVDPNAGPDVLTVAKRVSKGNKLYRDPFAFSEDCFLAANKEGILVMDGEGNTEIVYKPAGGNLECHEPRALATRPRERVSPSRVNPAKPTGQLVLADISHGRKMEGVEPGEIKKLLVLEQLPEPVHFSGGMEPISIGGTFTLARVLGTVPVEPDGSAFMELPALRSLFLVALDKDDLSVKRMQSFVTLQPAERTLRPRDAALRNPAQRNRPERPDRCVRHRPGVLALVLVSAGRESPGDCKEWIAIVTCGLDPFCWQVIRLLLDRRTHNDYFNLSPKCPHVLVGHRRCRECLPDRTVLVLAAQRGGRPDGSGNVSFPVRCRSLAGRKNSVLHRCHVAERRGSRQHDQKQTG